MPPRSRTPIAFGEGLDRESGSMIVRPSTFTDLRNVLLHEGSLLIRPGFTARGTGLYADVDRLVAGQPIKSERIGIVVGYSTTSEEVHVYRVSANGTDVEHLGEWTNDQTTSDRPTGWGSDVPRIIMAEVYGKVFMAHDQASITRRAPTLYYDPIDGSDVLNTLTDDFTSTSGESVSAEENVRFRGVVRHLNYLVGWGFGSDTEIRPELVRISKPGEPTEFDKNAYIIVGGRNDPVTSCAVAGGVLLAHKRTETHVIHGYDRRTFGVRLLDPLFGCISGRLAVTFGGIVVAWSEEGPRLWTGQGPSQPLDLPLGLNAFEASDLVAEGEGEDAFAFYVPEERVVWFVFGRRVYSLTVRVPGRWRWSLQELGFDSFCGFTLHSGTPASADAPAGYPEFMETDDESFPTVPGGTYIDVAVTNHDQEGDETIEVYMRKVFAGSGETTEVGGVTKGATDFSEFDTGTDPSGLTKFGNVTAAVVANDVNEGNYIVPTVPAVFGVGGIGIDAFGETITDTVEILARLYIPANNKAAAGPAWYMASAGGSAMDVVGLRSFRTSTPRAFGVVVADGATSVGSGLGGNVNDADFPGATTGWYWMRVRIEPSIAGPGFEARTRMRVWTGDIEDEPASWDFDVDQNALPAFWDDGGAMGLVLQADTSHILNHRMAFFSFTSDPDDPPIGPNDIPDANGPWFFAGQAAVAAGSTQKIRIEDLDGGQKHDVSLRYRRGTQHNPGAENTADPSTWPSVSRGQATTTVDPPTFVSAEWERTASDAEQITLTVTPAAGAEDEDIEVFRDEVSVGTIEGPHVGNASFVDDTISGETLYEYTFRTKSSSPGPQGDVVEVWSGPATIPVYSYQAVVGGGYLVGFTTEDADLATELHDSYDDAGSIGAHSLRATADAGETEVESGTLTNVPSGGLTFPAKLRHKATSFTVDDYGQFTSTFNVTVPESE